MNKKEKLAFCFNLAIFVFSVFGSVLAFFQIRLTPAPLDDSEYGVIRYFTVQSNVLAGIVALLYLVFYLKNKSADKKVPLPVNILKYVATVDLTITFLVVALFLGFIAPDGYFSVYTNANFFFHLIIPLLNVVSFVYFEPFYLNKKVLTLFGIVHLFLYSVFYQIVALSHFENGKVDIKYDWYAFAQNGVIVALLFAVVLLAIGYLTAFAFWKIKIKRK